MKKQILIIVAVLLVAAVFTACSTAAETVSSEQPSASAETTTATTEQASSEESAADVTIPEGVKGKKIVVIFNLAPGDYTQQFMKGAVDEAKALGFQVDQQVTNGDDAKLQEVVAQCAEQGYDGMVVSHAQLSYAYDMFKPVVDKGIALVVNNSMPFQDGDTSQPRLEGVISVSQDDLAMATLSLDSMIEQTGKKPVRVLKTFMGPGYPPLDTRNIIYTKYEEEGLIETVEVIAPTDIANVRGDMTNKTAAILPKYPEGSVDAVWGCYDELAKGVLQALKDANRTDIPIFSIDVSDDDMNLMVNNPETWKSTAACDAGQVGQANVMLLALQLAGDPDIPNKPDETFDYLLAPSLINTSQLTADTTMLNLAEIVPGWASMDLIAGINRPWMDALRAQNGSAS